MLHLDRLGLTKVADLMLRMMGMYWSIWTDEPQPPTSSSASDTHVVPALLNETEGEWCSNETAWKIESHCAVDADQQLEPRMTVPRE